MRGVLAILALLAATSGCGTSDDRDQARATVERFYAAIGDDRPEEACAQLGTALLEELGSCESAIEQLTVEGGEVERTQVFITNAKVDLSSGESAFLSREPGGWKLTAIACRAVKGKPADRPLECEAQA